MMLHELFIFRHDFSHVFGSADAADVDADAAPLVHFNFYKPFLQQLSSKRDDFSQFECVQKP